MDIEISFSEIKETVSLFKDFCDEIVTHINKLNNIIYDLNNRIIKDEITDEPKQSDM